MAKKGFTLVEVIVVVIIISILASLASTRYHRIAEKGRAAEAKRILGAIRQAQGAYYFQYDAYSNNLVVLSFGYLPTTCTGMTDYYFKYLDPQIISSSFNATATRCDGANGKQPGWSGTQNISIFANGTFKATADYTDMI